MGGCQKEQETDKKPAFVSDGKEEASPERGNCLAQRTVDAAVLENKKGERDFTLQRPCESRIKESRSIGLEVGELL